MLKLLLPKIIDDGERRVINLKLCNFSVFQERTIFSNFFLELFNDYFRVNAFVI